MKLKDIHRIEMKPSRDPYPKGYLRSYLECSCGAESEDFYTHNHGGYPMRWETLHLLRESGARKG
jgi:hypothetical protein